MSIKFEVNFESLFERLVDYTVIDDIKAITIINTKKYVFPINRRDNDREKFLFDIMINFSRLSFFFSIYPVHSKTELIYKELS